MSIFYLITLIKNNKGILDLYLGENNFKGLRVKK